MVMTERFRPLIARADKSGTQDLGQPMRGYRWIAVSSSQPLLACSGSTPGYSHLIFNANWPACNIYNNPEGNEYVTFHIEAINEQIAYFQAANDQDAESKWIKMHFGAECIIVTAATDTSSSSTTDTGSNLQEEDYGESVSAETSSIVEELAYLLQLEPIEDGYFHPAEKLVEDSLKLSKFDPNHWAYAAYFKNIESDSTLAAGVLRLLGRFPHTQVGEWGIVIAINGLSHTDIEVRNAAVRALERWGGPGAFKALKAYLDIEPIPWLAAYIRQVIIDLED